MEKNTSSFARPTRRTAAARAAGMTLAGLTLVVGGLAFAAPANAAPAAGSATVARHTAPITVDRSRVFLSEEGETTVLTGRAQPGSYVDIERQDGSVLVYGVRVDEGGTWIASIALWGSDFGSTTQLVVRYSDGTPGSAGIDIDYTYAAINKITVESGALVLGGPGDYGWVSGHARPGSSLNLIYERGGVFKYNIPVDDRGRWSMPVGLWGDDYGQAQLTIEYADGTPGSVVVPIEYR